MQRSARVNATSELGCIALYPYINTKYRANLLQLGFNVIISVNCIILNKLSVLGFEMVFGCVGFFCSFVCGFLFNFCCCLLGAGLWGFLVGFLFVFLFFSDFSCSFQSHFFVYNRPSATSLLWTNVDFFLIICLRLTPNFNHDM